MSNYNEVLNHLPALETFFQSYLPTKDFNEATEHYTTKELYDKLCQAEDVQGVTSQDLAKYLEHKGYHQEEIDTLKRVWLFKLQLD